MIELLTTLAPILGPSGLLAAVVVYIVINSQRKETKSERDKQFKHIDLTNHDAMLKLQFDVQYLKDEHILTKQIIEDLRDSINTLNSTNASLQTTLNMILKGMAKD